MTSEEPNYLDKPIKEPNIGGSSLSLEKKGGAQPVNSLGDKPGCTSRHGVEDTTVAENRLAGEGMTVMIAGVETRFRWCPPGWFMMGSPESERGRIFTESLHEVTIPHGFWLAETPTTQQLWHAVTGENPSTFQGDYIPVHEVSWDDCQAFIGKIQQYSPVGMRFKLPSEEHWEYACRAGTRTPFSFGAICNDDYANCDPRYSYGTGIVDKIVRRLTGRTKGPTPVRSYAANPWGLYDMHGNVWEWCEDLMDLYPGDPRAGTELANQIRRLYGSNRVLRGGSWGLNARFCRSAIRISRDPAHRDFFSGFRLLLTAEE